LARSAEFDVLLDRLDGGGGVVVRVRGDLDMATVPELEQALATIDLAGLRAIDLSDCEFIDSAAVRLLTVTGREVAEQGGTLAVVATDPGVRRVLEITAVDTVLPVHTSLESAL
jgi:anti-anti-sigma factor